ncbi:MAG: hypothetical protein ACE37F_20120 [Nannocystaceae bacterium]|nr:hypothetical protein [bacterium]
MSEPNDLDPAPAEDPIAASLKRQFSPPSLQAIEARVAAEAANLEADQLEADADDGETGPAGVPAAANEPRGWWMVAAAFVAAAALVLLIAWPTRDDAAPQGEPGPHAPPIAQTERPLEVIPPSTSERAGHQLDGFLRRGDALASADACGPREPPEVCDVEAGGYPHLPPAAAVTLLGECGGRSGTSCDTFDLPADRALLVQLSTGEHAIVCIEHPWTDPKPTLPPGSRYNLFRRELGAYILYEVTPRPEPEAAPLVRL